MCRNESDANAALADASRRNKAPALVDTAKLRKDIKAFLDHPDRYDNPSKLECWLWALGSLGFLLLTLYVLAHATCR